MTSQLFKIGGRFIGLKAHAGSDARRSENITNGSDVTLEGLVLRNAGVTAVDVTGGQRHNWAAQPGIGHGA